MHVIVVLDVVLFLILIFLPDFAINFYVFYFCEIVILNLVSEDFFYRKEVAVS